MAQIKTDEIWGSWVKTKLTFEDGSELPEENILKNTYVKYTFTVPDKMNFSGVYWDNGSSFIFEILNNEIMLRTTAGSIYAVVSRDTIYEENEKVYASYKGESFQRYITGHIGGGDYMTGRAGHLVASFIISKTGIADSLKILESIDKDFDKRFIKTFNSAKKEWEPAHLKGKNVPVQMFVELTCSTFGPSFSATQYSDKANIAFKQNDYQLALYYYDQALKNIPFDKENLYNRGICKKMLGNLAGACEDWKKIKELGGKQADDLLAKYGH